MNKKLISQQLELFPEYVSEKTKKETNRKTKLQLLEERVKVLEKENKTLKVKADAFDELISSNSLFTTTVVAKSFGWSAIKLNQYLKDKGIQYQQGEVWVLYAKYANKGYTQICWYDYAVTEKGKNLSRAHSYWTAKGIVFIRSLLKADGKL